MITSNIEENASSDSPFYLTKFWFNTLNRYVFSENNRINLTSADNTLAHISTTSAVSFLKVTTLKSLTNYYSPEFLPEQFNGDEKECDIASFYTDVSILSHYDLLDLTPLSERNADGVARELGKCGFYCEKYQVNTNWMHPNISSVDEFWLLRPNRLKNTLRRRKAKIEKENQYSIKILAQDNSDSLEQLLSDYHDVYSKSWKNNEPYINFIDDIAKEEHKKGKLRLGVLYYNDIAVAAQIWFVHHKTAYIFKLSYDDAYRTDSFGSILMEALFNHVITQDKVTTVDFLTGNDKYKSDWMTTSRPLFGIKAYNKKTFKGFICALSIKLKNSLRSNPQQTVAAE